MPKTHLFAGIIDPLEILGEVDAVGILFITSPSVSVFRRWYDATRKLIAIHPEIVRVDYAGADLCLVAVSKADFTRICGNRKLKRGLTSVGVASKAKRDMLMEADRSSLSKPTLAVKGDLFFITVLSRHERLPLSLGSISLKAIEALNF
jgi:hypothetical protein